MRLASIESVQPEVFLAKTIYDSMGRVLLAKGTCLTSGYIKRLMELEYRSIYIEDEISESIDIKDVIPDEARQQVSQITRETLINAKKGSPIQERHIKRAVDDIIDELLNNRDAVVHLTEIRSMQDYAFKHSVNVCVLSVLTGLSMGYHQLKLKQLGIGALLHDVGLAKLPEAIIGRDILTDQDLKLYHKHCEYGWEVLKKTDNIGIVAAHVALQHHERYDGSGYPRGLSDKGIIEFARIVCIADVYDTLASDHPQRKRMLPHEVIELIKLKQGTDFDPGIVSHFISIIAPFPAGSIVLLNTGFKAIVVSVPKTNPTRPIVRLLYDDSGQKIERIKYMDLMLQPAIFVSEVIND